MAKVLVPKPIPDEDVKAPENGDNVNADPVLGQVGDINPQDLQVLLNKIFCVFDGRVALRGIVVNKLLAGKVQNAVDDTVFAPIHEGETLRSLSAFAGYVELVEGARLRWLNVLGGAVGANPPLTQPLINDLRALNTPKAWGLFRSTDAPNRIDGCNITAGSIDVVDKSKFDVILAAGMSTENYLVHAGGTNVATGARLLLNYLKRTAADQFTVGFSGVDLSVTNVEIDLLVFGRQAS